MRTTRRGRCCGRSLAVLAAVSCLLILLLPFLLTTPTPDEHEPPTPASTASHCSSDPLTLRADPDLVTLYFAPRARPVTRLVSRFPLQPAPDTCLSRLDLLILVPSTPGAALQRQAVRQTWGSVVSQSWPPQSTGADLHSRVALVFLLGRKDSEESFVDPASPIRQEAVSHGDLLVGDFVDSYRNLTRKMLAGLNWVSRHCGGRVSYVLKADQDTFVRVDLLLDLIRRLQGAGPRHRPLTNTMLGELLCSEPANRDPESRVFVDASEYPFPVYPPYVRGGSYLLSGDLVSPLVNASRYLPMLPVEDAFINGVLGRALHVRHVHLAGVMKGLACPLSPCLFLGTGQISATNVDPDMMRAIWDQVRAGGGPVCRRQASWWTRVCVWVSRRLG